MLFHLKSSHSNIFMNSFRLYLRLFYSWILGAIKQISCSKTYFHCFICPTIKQITMKPGNFFKNKWENSKSWGLNEVWLEEIWLLWSSQQGYLVAERCVERRSFTLTCPSAAEKPGSKERRIYEEESSYTSKCLVPSEQNTHEVLTKDKQFSSS